MKTLEKFTRKFMNLVWANTPLVDVLQWPLVWYSFWFHVTRERQAAEGPKGPMLRSRVT